MLFCFTANYAPSALNAAMDNPTTSRVAAATQLIEAAGGKLVAMYGTVIDGPGAMVIFDVPDPASAAAISGVATASGAMHNVKLQRLLSPDELVNIRTKAAQLRSAYKAPGQ